MLLILQQLTARNVRFRPFGQLVEFAAFMKRLKVGRLAESHPRVDDRQERRGVPCTHEVQSDGFDAVVHVRPKHSRAIKEGYLTTVVEGVPVGILPHQVLKARRVSHDAILTKENTSD